MNDMTWEYHRVFKERVELTSSSGLIIAPISPGSWALLEGLRVASNCRFGSCGVSSFGSIGSSTRLTGWCCSAWPECLLFHRFMMRIVIALAIISRGIKSINILVLLVGDSPIVKLHENDTFFTEHVCVYIYVHVEVRLKLLVFTPTKITNIKFKYKIREIRLEKFINLKIRLQITLCR